MRLFIATSLLLTAACTSSPAKAKAAEDPGLYYALEVKRDGHLIAHPKLLGEVNKTVRAQRRRPGASEPDYQLVITAHPDGQRYRLSLDLALPDLAGHSELAMLHGEVRQLELGSEPGQLQVSVLLMKVDSPEFRALMNLAEQDARRAGAI